MRFLINTPEISAYHEAGHAFMAIFVGALVRSVTIEPDWDDGPARHADIQVEWPLDPFADRDLHENSVQVALAHATHFGGFTRRTVRTSVGLSR